MGTAIDKTVSKTVENGLCTGCGTCAGVCPVDAIEMAIEHKKGIYVPQLHREKCSQCGLCLEACPGHAVDFRQLNLEIFAKQPDDALLGNYISCYTGHATDYDIRYNSASGGLVTALLIFALEQGMIDGALVTRMKKDEPLEPEPFIARARDELVEAAKSKYCPVAANVALREILRAKDGERFAVVGLPCHMHGVRKAQSVSKTLTERIALHLGLVCAHTDSFLMTDFILRQYRIEKGELGRIDYRGRGWPGYLTICSRGGTEIHVPYSQYIPLHELRFFMPWRCSLCADFISRFADITFMDAWLPQTMAEDSVGKSIIVSRTEIGDKLLCSAKSKKVVELAESSRNEAASSQGRARLANTDLKANFLLSRLRGNCVPHYDVSLPRSGIVNYLRALVVTLNRRVSSTRHLWRLVKVLLYLESGIFQRMRSEI